MLLSGGIRGQSRVEEGTSCADGGRDEALEVREVQALRLAMRKIRAGERREHGFGQIVQKSGAEV